MGRFGIGIIFFCMILVSVIPITITADETEDDVTNHTPIPVISFPLEFTKYGTSYEVVFDGRNSIDEDDDELQFLWHSDKEGYLGNSSFFKRCLTSDNHMITLYVTDGTIGNATSISITIIDDRPVVDTDRDGKPDIIDEDDDNDGLLDIHEDNNMNGLIDENETDPKNPDTDGDGVNDKIDVLPLDPLIWKSEAEYYPPLICMIGGIIFLLFCSGILVLIFLIDHGMWKKKSDME